MRQRIGISSGPLGELGSVSIPAGAKLRQKNKILDFGLRSEEWTKSKGFSHSSTHCGPNNHLGQQRDEPVKKYQKNFELQSYELRGLNKSSGCSPTCIRQYQGHLEIRCSNGALEVSPLPSVLQIYLHSASFRDKETKLPLHAPLHGRKRTL